MKTTLFPFRQPALGLWLLLSLLFTTTAFAQTVLFRDDFDRATLGSQWVRQEGWRAEQGQALNDQTDGTSSGYLITAQSFPATEYVLESKASNLVRGYFRVNRLQFGQASLVGEPSTGEQPFNNYYSVEYDAYFGRLSLARSEGNPYFPVILDRVVITLDPAVPHRFKVIRRASGTMQVFLDRGQGYGAAPVLAATDQTYPQLGHFGWQVSTETAAASFYVDYIQATTLPLIADVRAANGKPYGVTTAQVGAPHYLDRPYTFTALPAFLNGANLLRTANDDKGLTAPADTLLRFRVDKPALIYVAYDPRSTKLPAWLSGFTLVADQIGTTDPGSSTMKLYARAYPAGAAVALGANLAPPAVGSNMMYLVFAVPAPEPAIYQAEDARAQGPLVLSTNAGYEGRGYQDYQAPSADFVEWTLNVAAPGPYALDFRYALQTGNRPLAIQLNSDQPTTWNFPATGGWETWGYASREVVLKAGTNTIRATAIGSSGPNVDWLRLAAQPLAAARRPAVSAAPLRATAELRLAVTNPVEEVACFDYQLRTAAPVRLQVFDWRGQPVSTVLEQTQAAGPQRLAWPTTGLRPGIYFYRLQVGGSTYSGRLLKK